MAPTEKQRQIFEALLFLVHKGERPTVREIGALVGLRSPATVLKHLQALEREGLIHISGKSRGIRVCSPPPNLASPIGGAGGAGTADPTFGAVEDVEVRPTNSAAWREGGRENLPSRSSGRSLPDVPSRRWPRRKRRNVPATFTGSSPTLFSGPVRSGGLSSQPSRGSFPEISIDPGLFAGSGELLALRVAGESMIEAGILDGDLVIVRRQPVVEDGEIAAVEIDGEVTLKQWRRSRGSFEPVQEGSGPSGEAPAIRLIPANAAIRPIEIAAADGKEVRVLGKYVGLVRGARLP